MIVMAGALLMTVVVLAVIDCAGVDDDCGDYDVDYDDDDDIVVDEVDDDYGYDLGYDDEEQEMQRTEIKHNDTFWLEILYSMAVDYSDMRRKKAYCN